MNLHAASTVLLTALLTAIPAIAQAAVTPACPHDMAQVGDSCVDKYEGSLVEINEDGSESAFSAYATPVGHKVRAVSRPDVAPQAHISMVEAQKACGASGKRLCHAKEWKTACKGPSQTRYPYGDKHVENACVDTDRTSPVNKLHAGLHDATTMNDPELNQQDNTVEPTGNATSCTNDFGVYDMVGNVHEWADDGAFHGGYYLDTKINGEGCEYATTAHSATYYDYSTGFRCCADAGTLQDEEEAETTSTEPETKAPETLDAALSNAHTPAVHAPMGSHGGSTQAAHGIGAAAVQDRRRTLASRVIAS